MKRFIFITAFLLFVQTLPAQEETTISSEEEYGGFGGPVIKYTSVRSTGSLMIGGRGGWIIDHSLIIGGGGYSLVTEVDALDGVIPSQGPLDIKFSYIGAEIEYLFHPMSLLHLSIATLIGFGETFYVKDVGSVNNSNEQVSDKAYMFVTEPSVSVELNLLAWFRLDIGISYRFVPSVNLIGVKGSDFSSPGLILLFKFGSF